MCVLAFNLLVPVYLSEIIRWCLVYAGLEKPALISTTFLFSLLSQGLFAFSALWCGVYFSWQLKDISFFVSPQVLSSTGVVNPIRSFSECGKEEKKKTRTEARLLRWMNATENDKYVHGVVQMKNGGAFLHVTTMFQNDRVVILTDCGIVNQLDNEQSMWLTHKRKRSMDWSVVHWKCPEGKRNTVPTHHDKINKDIYIYIHINEWKPLS